MQLNTKTAADTRVNRHCISGGTFTGDGGCHKVKVGHDDGIGSGWLHCHVAFVSKAVTAHQSTYVLQVCWYIDRQWWLPLTGLVP